MKDICRICARELCGNQRRWIFHTASKLNLQVLLSHVLEKEVLRDGRAEFACSKCAFMLDRIYRFDTVIARIEALSIDRLQKLISEKDRLKLCVASLYRKNNEDLCTEGKGGDGTVDVSILPDAHYVALLQDDFAYSGFESWTERGDTALEHSNCQATEGTENRSKRCHCCAVLRVPDADYEAVCKVPRKLARSISTLPPTRFSAIMFNEELPEPILTDVQLDKMIFERESMEKVSSVSSVESFHGAIEDSPLLHREEEPIKGTSEEPKWDFGVHNATMQSCSLQINKLDVALSLVKAFDYKPVQSPKGSRIPVKSSPPGARSTSLTSDGSSLLIAGLGFMDLIAQSCPRIAHDFIPELADLQELWEDVYEDYIPLRMENLFEKQNRDLDSGDVSPEQCDSESQTAEFQMQTLQDRLQQLEAKNKMLHENLHEMNSQLLATIDASQQQDCTIQNLNETLSSKISEAEEMKEIIEEQSKSIEKLQEMLHQSQLDHFQVPAVLPSTQPQLDFFNLQNTLFCTQLELQKVQRTLRQSERQLTDARRAQQLMESDLNEAQKQKETTWTHNQELHVALHQLQVQLLDVSQQLETVREQKDAVIQEQKLTIQNRNQTLLQKEQLLQEHIYHLQYQEATENRPRINDAMLEKLHERIRDRDKALERAVDEKYCALEEREHKLRQLQLAMREKKHDLERLRSVLSSNEETINSLDSMLKSKDLEIGQISVMFKNLQWLKQEMEKKYINSIKERESFIQQLQVLLHDRSKELETLVASCLNKSSVHNALVEQLQFCLQSKEKMLQDVLNDRNQQTAEHEKEILKFLKTVSTRDQLNDVAAEKVTIYKALEGGVCQCKQIDQFSPKDLTMEMDGPPALNQSDELSRLQVLLDEKEDIIAELLERGSDHSKMMVIVKNNNRTNTEGNKDLQTMLEKELANAKEEFQLVSRKERETRAELCTLQSIVAKQNEDLQVQAADVESLARNVHIKEELIKDLQVQLVNPEEVPAVESLTHEVLKLREKVAIMELHGQEDLGNRSQELVLMLERLVTERARLNDALQSEMQIYSNLVKLQSQPKSCEESKTLQLELEAVRMLRGHLEEALGQSLKQLSNLEAENKAPTDFGAQHTDEDRDDDDSSEFTDSIEEDADMKEEEEPFQQTDQLISLDHVHQKPQSEMKMNIATRKFPYKVDCVKLEEPLGFRSEEDMELQEDVKESKAQTERAGIAPGSFCRNELQSSHLEVEKLKEPMGEAMSEWCEDDIEKAKEGGGLNEESLRTEVRRLQEKMTNAEMIIHLLKEQLALNSEEGNMKFNPELIVSMAKEIERLNADKGSAPMKHSALRVQLREDTAKKHCNRPQSLDLGALLHQSTRKEKSSSSGSMSQMEAGSQHTFWQPIESSLREETEQLRSELANNRQQNRELQDRLVVSEATVSAQAGQLNHYRILLREPSVAQDSKLVQVDLQDLGYETCGRSENEADREETTSPEFDNDQEDIFSETSMVEELNAQLKLWGSAINSTPQSTPMKCKPRTEELLESGKMEDVTLLLQHVNELKKQLERSERVIWSLKCKEHYFSASSDSGGGTGSIHDVTMSNMCECSLSHSITDEDEGWQSDGVRTISHSGIQTNKDLHQLTERVSSLEAQLQRTRWDAVPPHQLKTEPWSGRYDSLIQAQARELSLMRLKLREGKGVCHILTQRLSDTVKSFEELLRVNDIDYYMGQSFRDQLSEGSQLVERLSSKLSSKDHVNIDDKSGKELLSLRLSKELQQKDKIIEALNLKLQEHGTPSSSCAISESDPSERTSFVSDDQVSNNDDLEMSSHVDVTSEYTQYPESSTRNQGYGTSEFINHTGNNKSALSSKLSSHTVSNTQTSLPSHSHPMNTSQSQKGHHFNISTSSRAVPRALFPDHQSFLNTGLRHPFVDPGFNGAPEFSLAQVQQELQMLQKQLGESTPLTTPAVKQVQMPTNYIEVSNRSSSFQFDPLFSIQMPRNHSALNTAAVGLNHTADSALLESSGLWDMSHLIRPPNTNDSDKSSGSSGYQSASKITVTGNDLLEEHFNEIRSLRQRLEESIHTNDCLRKQLEDCLKSSKDNAYSGETNPSIPANFDFVELLSEIKTLRVQLEHSMQANRSLRRHMERQLEGSPAKPGQQPYAITIVESACDPESQTQQFQGALLSPPVRDVSMNAQPAFFSSSTYPGSTLTVPVPEHPQFSRVQKNFDPDNPVENTCSELEGEAPDGTFANKNGCHVIGHIDEYIALKQQVVDGKVLIHKMESLMQSSLNIPFLEIHGTKALNHGNIRQLFSSTITLRKILEEFSALLSMFWRAALPSTQSIGQQKREAQSKTDEILKLKKKLAEQENILQNTRERLINTSQMKEKMEKFIVGQLTRTHDVLRKARTNLEVNFYSALQSTTVM